MDISQNNSADSWNKKAVGFCNQGRYEEAIQCLDEAIRIEPNNASYLSNKDSILFSLEKYGEALNCLDEAINLDPNNASAWNNKGGILYKLERYLESIHCCDEAIRIEPNIGRGMEHKRTIIGIFGQNSRGICLP